MYYWKDGTPVEGSDAPMGSAAWVEALRSWSEQFENLEYRRVAETTLPDGRWVSTVWVGLDSGFHQDRPIIFETMVFENPYGGGGDLDSDRYSSEREAREGHLAMVERWRAKITLRSRLWWLLRPAWAVRLWARGRRRMESRRLTKAVQAATERMRREGLN